MGSEMCIRDSESPLQTRGREQPHASTQTTAGGVLVKTLPSQRCLNEAEIHGIDASTGGAKHATLQIAQVNIPALTPPSWSFLEDGINCSVCFCYICLAPSSHACLDFHSLGRQASLGTNTKVSRQPDNPVSSTSCAFNESRRRKAARFREVRQARSESGVRVETEDIGRRYARYCSHFIYLSAWPLFACCFTSAWMGIGICYGSSPIPGLWSKLQSLALLCFFSFIVSVRQAPTGSSIAQTELAWHCHQIEMDAS